MPNHVTNWSQEEDKKLTSLVSEKGNNDWSSIADQIHSKTPQQCKIRWTKHLNPKLNKEWTTEQKSQLFKLHKQYSNRWTDISRQLPRRCDLDVKNTFYNFFRKGLRRIGKLIGRENSTSQVKQMKPKQISKILKLYVEKYKNDFIYNVVLECALDSENKDFENSKPKHYSQEQIANLREIYQMFFKREVKIIKKLSRSLSRSLSISKINDKKDQIKEQVQIRLQNIQKKEKKIDIKLKKKQSKKIVQNETIEQKNSSEESLEKIPKSKEIRLQKKKEIQQKGIPKIEQKKKPKLPQKLMLKTQQQQPNTRPNTRPIVLFSRNLLKKKSSENLSFFNSFLVEEKDKQQKQKDACEDSSRNAITNGSGTGSGTRNAAAMIQASGRVNQFLFKDLRVSQQEDREINAQVFPSDINDLAS